MITKKTLEKMNASPEAKQLMVDLLTTEPRSDVHKWLEEVPEKLFDVSHEIHNECRNNEGTKTKMKIAKLVQDYTDKFIKDFMSSIWHGDLMKDSITRKLQSYKDKLKNERVGEKI